MARDKKCQRRVLKSPAWRRKGTEDPLAAAVLDANTAFYAAFSNGDADSMTALWADEQDVRSQLRALRAAAVLLPD